MTLPVLVDSIKPIFKQNPNTGSMKVRSISFLLEIIRVAWFHWELIATIKPIAGPDYTVRFNLFRSVEVTGSPAPGYTSNQARDALKEVAA